MRYGTPRPLISLPVPSLLTTFIHIQAWLSFSSSRRKSERDAPAAKSSRSRHDVALFSPKPLPPSLSPSLHHPPPAQRLQQWQLATPNPLPTQDLLPALSTARTICRTTSRRRLDILPSRTSRGWTMPREGRWRTRSESSLLAGSDSTMSRESSSVKARNGRKCELELNLLLSFRSLCPLPLLPSSSGADISSL